MTASVWEGPVQSLIPSAAEIMRDMDPLTFDDLDATPSLDEEGFANLFAVLNGHANDHDPSPASTLFPQSSRPASAMHSGNGQEGMVNGVPDTTNGYATRQLALGRAAQALPSRPARQPPSVQQKSSASFSAGSGFSGSSDQDEPDQPDRNAVTSANVPIIPPLKRGKRKEAPDLDSIADPKERRKQRRLAKNRATAAISRERRRKLLNDLQSRLQVVEEEKRLVVEENSRLAYALECKDAELVTLRRDVAMRQRVPTGPLSSNVLEQPMLTGHSADFGQQANGRHYLRQWPRADFHAKQ